MRFAPLFVCVLAVVLCILAPPAHSADLQQYLAARLELPEPGSKLNNVELVLENRSTKDIVAYAYLITSSPTEAQSLSVGGNGVDYVPSLAAFGRTAPITDKYTHVGPIRPGEVVYHIGPENRPNLSVVVKMVIFGDNTAVGNPEMIDNIFRERKAYAEELDRWRPRFDSPRLDLRQYFERMRDELAQSLKQQSSSSEESGRQAVRATLLSQVTGALFSKNAMGLEEWRAGQKSYLADEARAFREHSELRKEEE